MRDQRWALLWGCLRDEGLGLRLRVAGAVVLLYGQIPSRIVELSTDGIATSGSDTYLALHGHPVLLPPPLAAALMTPLAAQRSRERATTSDAETRACLFPSARLGAHLGHGRLTRLLNRRSVSSFVPPAVQRCALWQAICLLGCSPSCSDGRSAPPPMGWRSLRDEAHDLHARMTKPAQRAAGM